MGIEGVPRLVRFANTEIAMYFLDHPPPHFHVLGRDGSAQITIETLEVIALSGRIDVREALAWADDNRDILWAKWRELSGEGR
jgi:hypothetical protein